MFRVNERLEKGETYYYIFTLRNSDGCQISVENDCDEYKDFDDLNFYMGNYFYTKEQAKSVLELRKNELEMYDIYGEIALGKGAQEHDEDDTNNSICHKIGTQRIGEYSFNIWFYEDERNMRDDNFFIIHRDSNDKERRIRKILLAKAIKVFNF